MRKHNQKVHNVLHCRQRRTETRPQITCTKNLVKFRFVIFEIYERPKKTNRQTERQSDRRNADTVIGGEVIMTVTNNIERDSILDEEEAKQKEKRLLQYDTIQEV